MARSLFMVLFLSLFVYGCEDIEPEAFYAGNEALVATCGGAMRYPTSEQDFRRLYASRDFLVSGGPGAHLGRDIAYAEGTAIRPILCGRIAYYGAASGYGTLVIAIEHTLNRPVSVTNGAGQKVLVTSFLSIYGHLRQEAAPGTTPLAWRIGDTVSTDQVIGYVQKDALNGDGDIHLHLGIRLQSVAQAQVTDGRYWMRGYDSNPTKRSFFADPAMFLREVMASRAPIRWHPPGSYLVGSPVANYVVGADGGSLLAIDDLTAEREGFRQRPISVTYDELGCYTREADYWPRFADAPGSAPFVGRSQTSSTVELFYGSSVDGVFHRDAFVSWEALLSHGYTADDIGTFDASEWSFLQRNHPIRGTARLQEGSLVKARGAPAIYVVSNGRRRPIYNWNAFQAMGYDLRQVYEIEASTLDVVAGPLGQVLRLEEAMNCRRTSGI